MIKPAESHATISPAGIAVRCRGVAKDFGDGGTRVRVLHEIDLDVPAPVITQSLIERLRLTDDEKAQLPEMPLMPPPAEAPKPA